MIYRLIHPNGDTVQFHVRRPRRIVELLRYYRSIGFGLAICAGLAACSGQNAATATYDAKQALLAADHVALAYLAQPPCGATVAVTCVDPATKARIKQASATASAARKAADAAIAAGKQPDNASLTAAIVAFGAVVAPMQILVH